MERLMEERYFKESYKGKRQLFIKARTFSEKEGQLENERSLRN